MLPHFTLLTVTQGIFQTFFLTVLIHDSVPPTGKQPEGPCRQVAGLWKAGGKAGRREWALRWQSSHTTPMPVPSPQ